VRGVLPVVLPWQNPAAQAKWNPAEPTRHTPN
jgi:hypothetical protein